MTSIGSIAPKNIVAVDLFCGVGGLTNGLCQAGITVRAGFDLDESCKFAYEANNHPAKFIPMNVKDVSAKDLRPHFAGADFSVLVGCAPCQPFSALRKNRKESDSKDSRWELLGDFANIIREVRPDVVSMENVPGLRHQPVYREFVQTLEEHGYYVGFADVVNCADYGVPQSRKRLVVLASRHGDIGLPPPERKKDCTVRTALAKLRKNDRLHIPRKLSPKNRERIRQSKPGGSWRDWDPELVSPCHRKEAQDFPSPYGRMEWDKPAPTITTQFSFYSCGRFGHPEEERAISVRESALLQGFRPAYKFIRKDDIPREKMDALTRWIGNAVPPPLGRAIGKSIVNHHQFVRGQS